MFPELQNGDVFTIVEGFFAEIFVGEHARDVKKGGFRAIEESEEGVTQNVFKAGTPRVAEHTLEHADNFRTDVGFAGGITELERVESDWIGGIGRVEIDNVLNAVFGDEAEVVDGEIAVWIDDAVTLIIENVAKSKKFEHARFTSAGLSDNVDVARTVTAQHTKLVINTAEISQTKGRDILIVSGIAGNER